MMPNSFEAGRRFHVALEHPETRAWDNYYFGSKGAARRFAVSQSQDGPRRAYVYDNALASCKPRLVFEDGNLIVLPYLT